MRWRAYRPGDRWIRVGGHFGGAVRPLVLPESEVVDVRVVSGRVAGVDVRRNGLPERIRCGVAVLAAAAIENARLIAQARAPTSRPDTALTGLTDHIRQGFLALVPASWMPGAVLPAGLAHLPATRSLSSNMFVEVRPSGIAGFLIWDVWAIAEQAREAS